jgi:hypothetical protein
VLQQQLLQSVLDPDAHATSGVHSFTKTIASAFCVPEVSNNVSRENEGVKEFLVHIFLFIMIQKIFC